MNEVNKNQSLLSLAELETTLRDDLNQYARSHCYALLDAAQIPDLADEMRRGALRNLPCLSLFSEAPEENGNGRDAAPYLFHLSAGPDSHCAIAYTAQKALETYAVSWLISPLNMSVLAKRLTQRTEAQLTENMEVLLRFYDTRILPNLSRVLSPEQAAMVFGVAHAWRYADRAGQLQSCECQFADEDAFSAPLEFNQTQENKLTALAFPDAVLEQLHDGQSDLMTSMNRAEQHAFVARQITKLNVMGIESMPEILIYCVLALAEGENFAERMPWKEKMDAIKAGNGSLDGLGT